MIFCFVLTITDTSLTCRISGGSVGIYNILIYKFGFGFGDVSAAGQLTLELVITGISPVSGSTQGGTEIVITGVNFSPILLKNQVMIGNGFCEITAATSTEIRCTTISTVEALNVIGLIVPTNTGTITEPILELAVLGRIVEIATCDASIDCLYSYLLSETPEITSITNAAEVSAGETLTVSGTLNQGELKVDFE